MEWNCSNCLPSVDVLFVPPQAPVAFRSECFQKGSEVPRETRFTVTDSRALGSSVQLPAPPFFALASSLGAVSIAQICVVSF